MLQLEETTNIVVDTACGCHSHWLSLWFLPVAHVHSGFEIIAWNSGLGMAVGRFWSLLRGVEVLAMLYVRRDTMQYVESVCEVPPGVCVLQLLVSGIDFRVFINCCCAVDGVEVTCLLISATRELFSQNHGVEFWPLLIETTEQSLWEESLSPASAETRLFAGGWSECPGGLHLCSFWTFCMTGVVSGWRLSEDNDRNIYSTFRISQ